LSEGETLVRLAREPLQPLPFVRAGLAASLEGNDRKAEAQMVHAVRLDPRNTSARSWLFNLYLREERFGEAMDQAMVLFNLEPTLQAPLSRTLAILSQLDDARAIIIQRFAGTPYLDAILGSLPPGQLGEQALLQFAAAADPKTRVDTQSRIIADLLGRKDYAATARALRGFRGHAGQAEGLVYDGSFSGAKGPQPFTWSLTTSADVRAEAIADASGSALHVERFTASPAIVARQSILIKPGKYRLSHLLKTGDQPPSNGASPHFAWTVTCPELPKPTLATLPLSVAAASEWGPTAWTFEVPSTCKLVELALLAPLEDLPVRSDVKVKRVRLDPVTG
jgi:hypothetical protein